MTKVRPKIYERVLELMSQRGISRKELCKRTGWHEMKLWRLLNGHTQFKIKDLDKLSRILDCALVSFFEETRAA